LAHGDGHARAGETPDAAGQEMALRLQLGHGAGRHDHDVGLLALAHPLGGVDPAHGGDGYLDALGRLVALGQLAEDQARGHGRDAGDGDGHGRSSGQATLAAGNLPWTGAVKATRIAPRPGTGTRTMRGPKKSETLEIRLPHALKQAFMARCRDEGRSASEAVRDYIERSVIEPRRPNRGLRWAAVGLAAVSLGAVAAPSLARPSLPAQFARLDADHDGRLSRAEF